MRQFFLVVCTIILWCEASSQTLTYGNEWIDATKVHYKIKVSKDGIYRIPYTTLAGIIPNIGSINAAAFAIFHNGRQVPIYLSNNSTLGVSDYIEFYGRKNRGEMDSLLYANGNLQPNVNFSLFSDTSVYFLTTTNNPGANLRFVDVPNDLNNLPAKENYYWRTIINETVGTFLEGKYFTASNLEIYKSIFDEGEGYASSTFFGSLQSNSPPQVTSQNIAIAAPTIYLAGPAATLKVVYANNSREDHTVNLRWNSNLLNTQSNFGFKLNKLTFSLPAAQINAGNNNVNFTTSDNATSKRQNTHFVSELKFPSTFDFTGITELLFSLSADAANKKYIEITNYNANASQPVLYDITNGYRITATTGQVTPVLKFTLPPSANERQLYLRKDDAAGVTVVTQVSAVSFVNYGNPLNQGNYAIIYDRSLTDDGNGIDNIEEYRKYRDINANPLTGRYNAIKVDIEQLYDQFGFGIRKSPLGIRNFINYAAATFGYADSMNIFLIGKGREYTAMRTNQSAYAQSKIPTFGSPGSDNLFAATRSSDIPVANIGRLAAINGSQVGIYLQKVREYETTQGAYASNQKIEEKDWMKDVLHFSGGTSTNEQISFRAYLNNYGQIVRDTLWGAEVSSYAKTSSAPIDEALSTVIRNRINRGVSLITFFGHSATGAFDLSIDEPENYTNTGRYPLILSNGCFSGFLHDVSPGFSERFVLQANKGAIAFMATSSLSVPQGLDNFSSKFYKNFTRENYTQTLGKLVNETLKDVYPVGSDYDKMVAYEMTLHGDPAIKINQYLKPDYAIQNDANFSSVFFNPSTVTPGVDSFEVNIVVTNLGRAIKDSINVTLKRTVFDPNNGNAPVVYNVARKVAAPYFRDTVTFKVATSISTLGYGQNLFDMYVEADQIIDEMAENNNYLLSPISIYIQSDDIIPIYPYEYAIVPNQAVILKASTVNPFAAPRNYKFEIDTSELFTNPLQTATIFQGGGVVKWTPAVLYKDSTVYYWRVAKDSSVLNWRTSSFIYLANEFPGWNQSHYYQWKKDDYLLMSYDNDRIFRFPPTTNEIKVVTGNGLANNPNFENLGWDYNNANMHRWRMGGCGFLNGITFAVIDSATGLPLASKNAVFPLDNWGDKFGNFHCSDKTDDQYGFDFATSGNHPAMSPTQPNSALFSNAPWWQVIRNFYDSVPAGSYVLMYSTNVINYALWDSNMVNTLQLFGFPAQTFSSGSVNGPFVFFTKKGSPSFSSFTAYQNGYVFPLDTSFTFTGTWYQGQFVSPKIGPAAQWGSVHWSNRPKEAINTDVNSMDIIGVNNQNIETVLYTTSVLDTQINFINAATYPYIRLRLNSRDNTFRTPTQMQYWRVLYQKVPEAAINPSAYFEVINDTVNQGSAYDIKIGLENVTELPMDSMLTKYTLRDALLGTDNTFIRQEPLPALDTITLHYNKFISGNNYLGQNKLIIEANPDNDQPEQFHFNNIAEIDFSAVGDKTNPLLDVTFDGQHIMNGDIVSAKPEIVVTLKDENTFLALNDTSNMEVYIKYPGEQTPRRMSYDNAVMTFYPADSTNLVNNNKAQIELKPVLDIDGTYELIVKDRDRSGNHSSNQPDRSEGNINFDYKTTFEVINKPSITNVLNYPNPFSTATKFVFTITGSEIPDIMKIQIMTIKGTVVKEIMKEELGSLHIGRNITEYTWNGRDEYGDVLANGVYFYRVVTRLDDKRMDHMDQNYDKYFKKGFGKMVILR
jgi:hypothetical protein